ncbi:TonB-dependent hemoglobin/transferrin/lactoferrin family receptor [Pseudomonas solani]|uniref:TonB-dependent receptor n=1 Tax=Pseudomonas solani TaxID=2731552 RepID=UPI003C2F4927
MNAYKGPGQRFHRALLALGGSWMLACAGELQAVESAPATTQAQQALVAFDIPVQPLSSAVLAFAEQSGVQVIFDAALLEGLQGNAVRGRLEIREGLQALLRGHPVSYSFSSPRQVSLTRTYADAGSVMQLGATHVQSQADANDWMYRTPRSVAVIGREQIDRNPPRHAADMLEETSGVYSIVSQQDPGLSVNIRGLQDFGRVNMSIDGARQNFQQSGHQQRNGEVLVDTELLTQVDIEKGPTSGMGGAGVIGGIANFRTLNVEDVLLPGHDYGARLRGTTGLGGYDNGTNFIGSAAFALDQDLWSLLVAHSEKHLGEYEPGQRGKSGAENQLGLDAQPGKPTFVKFTNQMQRSDLFKLGLKLAPDQTLGFSYLESRVSYDNASMANALSTDTWRKTGEDKLTNKLYSLDYSYTPDNPLIDLQAKLYYGTTRNEQDILKGNPPANYPTDYCDVPRSTATWERNCAPAYSITHRTDTWGAQLQNTSTFELDERSTVTANYGMEYFEDKTKPEAGLATARVATDPIGDTLGVTPKGTREMASLFTGLGYRYDDWLQINGGLRYDRYHLEGHTRLMPYRDFYNRLTTQSYDVDEERGHFSPTFSIAVNPGLDWLQLFANYGKGWRPPAITETLMNGTHIGDAASKMYPNPFLKPEESRTWEVGFNLFKEGLFLPEDKLTGKVAYFDTKVDDYMFMSLEAGLPNTSYNSLGTSAFVNSLSPARFKGVEYELEYDTERWYTGLTYTHMIGKNDLCYKVWYLGPSAVATGQEWRDNLVKCGFMMGSAEHMPMDRGSWHGGLRFFDKKLDIGLRARYSEGFFETYSERRAAGEEDVYPLIWKSYVVWDFYSAYRVSDNLTLRLSVENLRDRAYVVPMGDALAATMGRGRTAQGTVEIRF